jgi:hypothetical protein
MLPKILRYTSQRLVAISGLLLGVFSVILYVISTSAVILICQEALYTSTYSACTDRYEIIFTYTPIVGGLLACVLIVSHFLRSVKSRKELRHLSLGYIFFVLIILVPLSTQEFCLGFLGCSSLAPFAFALGLVVLVSALGASALVNLFWLPVNSIYRVVIIIVVTILFVFVTYYILAAPEKLSKSDFMINHDLEDVALRMKDVEVCSRTIIRRHKDECISSYAIHTASITQCESINASDIKEEYIAFVIRNKAIDTLDIELCNQITIPFQVSVCKRRINEKSGS